MDAKEYKAPIKKIVVDYLVRTGMRSAFPMLTVSLLQGNKSTHASGIDGEESQPKPSKKRKAKVDDELVKPRKSAASKPETSSKGKHIPKSAVSSLHKSTSNVFTYESPLPSRNL